MTNFFEKYDLNHKVEGFIAECTKEKIPSQIHTTIRKFYYPRELKDFIELKAGYSELRLPIVSVYPITLKKKIEYDSERFSWEEFNERAKGIIPSDRRVNLAVLYRIIERGGNRVGPRRGVIFAQEYKLDINIPVSYSIDYSDPFLLDFLEPLIQQINLDMVCPANYFHRNSNRLDNVEEVILRDFLEEKSVKKLSEKE